MNYVTGHREYYMADDWWDELRNPLAAICTGAFLLCVIAIVGVLVAEKTGKLSLDDATAWAIRILMAACGIVIAYASVKAIQAGQRHYSERRHGFEVRQDKDETK